MPDIPRPAPDECASYYHRYIAQVPDGDLTAFLTAQLDETAALLDGLPAERAGFRYAPGKWSVREVVGHVADAERVFAYRALRIARGDATPLPAFDENAYVDEAGFDDRPLADLLDEFRRVRLATLALLDGLPDDVFGRWGTASDHPVTVRALAYITAGHAQHHLALFRERYGLGAASTA